jgi:hypothetical protein
MPQPQNHHAYVNPFKPGRLRSDELVSAYGVANLGGSVSRESFTLSGAREFHTLLGRAIAVADLEIELAR